MARMPIRPRDAAAAGVVLLALATVLVLWPGTGCRREPPRVMHGPVVRVRLLAGAAEVQLAATDPPTLRATSDSSPQKIPFPPDTAMQVALSSDGWRVGEVTLGTGELIVQPSVEGSVTINGKAYRGRYRLVPAGAAKFDVVNDVDIDSYLMGVIGSELLSGWHEEAYKSQAIAARTYAIYEAKTSGPGRQWDLYPDTRSQVYGGIAAETSKSVDAVQDTAGIVLAYGPKGQERIFKAYFSACCGGVSQSAYDGLGDSYLPPLSEQNVGALCNESPKFNWGPIVLSKQELTRRIHTGGTRRDHPIAKMAELDRIDVQYVNRFSRPVKFLLTDVRGQQYMLSSEETRQACNVDANKNDPMLPGSFFKPITETGVIRFAEGH